MASYPFVMSRSLVQDPTLGLGSFRWGDTRATVQDTYPDAVWGRVEPVYAFKKAFSISVFEVSDSLLGTAVIDPDAGGAQMVRVSVGVDAWPEVAELARAFGAPEVPDELGHDDVLSWQTGLVEIEIARDFDFDGIYLRLERPLDAERDDDGDDDDESIDDAFDFDD